MAGDVSPVAMFRHISQCNLCWLDLKCLVQAVLAEEEAEVTATVQQEVSHITSNINKVGKIAPYFFKHLAVKKMKHRREGILWEQLLDQFGEEVFQHIWNCLSRVRVEHWDSGIINFQFSHLRTISLCNCFFSGVKDSDFLLLLVFSPEWLHNWPGGEVVRELHLVSHPRPVFGVKNEKANDRRDALDREGWSKGLWWSLIQYFSGGMFWGGCFNCGANKQGRRWHAVTCCHVHLHGSFLIVA